MLEFIEKHPKYNSRSFPLRRKTFSITRLRDQLNCVMLYRLFLDLNEDLKSTAFVKRIQKQNKLYLHYSKKCFVFVCVSRIFLLQYIPTRNNDA